MNSQSRSPIVVVLGHVDHGKTTLLDYLRKSNVAQKEEGAITQKIGAYELKTEVTGYPVSTITFIDTPGHEAFTKIRSRGANIADVAILLIDGVESVKPQTIESIEIIQKLDLPFVVALNKVDLPNFNPERVKKDLLKYQVLTEGFGGNTPVVNISAKNGQNVDDLIEAILFIWSEKNVTYDTSADLEAYVIEVNKTKAGIAVSCIIKNGQINVGQTLFCEGQETKVKSLINDRGVRIDQVNPSSPFVLLGFDTSPMVGAKLSATKNTESPAEVVAKIPSDVRDFFAEKDERKKFKMIIKTDNHGSLEAVVDNFKAHESVIIESAGIGEVVKSDIFLAKVTGAVIINFGQPISKDSAQIAKDEKVLIRSYSLIYKLLEEIEDVLAYFLEKDEKKSRFKGQGKIIANFIIDAQNIAGVTIQTGKITVGDEIELIRGDNTVGVSKAVSLKQKTKTVSELKKNEEGGLLMEPHLDFKVGDMVKSYRTDES